MCISPETLIEPLSYNIKTGNISEAGAQSCHWSQLSQMSLRFSNGESSETSSTPKLADTRFGRESSRLRVVEVNTSGMRDFPGLDVVVSKPRNGFEDSGMSCFFGLAYAESIGEKGESAGALWGPILGLRSPDP